jgi:hypothetical protein
MSEKFYKEKYLKYKKKYLELKQSGGAAIIASNNMRRQREEAERRRREENEEQEYQKLCQENETKWKEEIINLTNTLQNANCDNIYTNKIKNGNKCKNLKNEIKQYNDDFNIIDNKCVTERKNKILELLMQCIDENDINILKNKINEIDQYVDQIKLYNLNSQQKMLLNQIRFKFKLLEDKCNCNELKEMKSIIDMDHNYVENKKLRDDLNIKYKDKLHKCKCTYMSQLSSSFTELLH